MTPTKAKSKVTGIHQKIHAMMKKLEYIQKDKTNDHFGYNYLSEQAIKAAIQPLLVEHGVVFLMKTTNVRETGNLTSSDFEGSFTDIDSGESIIIPCHGQGQDNSDKGYPKSVTNAIKYLMTSTLPHHKTPPQKFACCCLVVHSLEHILGVQWLIKQLRVCL